MKIQRARAAGFQPQQASVSNRCRTRRRELYAIGRRGVLEWAADSTSAPSNRIGRLVLRNQLRGLAPPARAAAFQPQFPTDAERSEESRMRLAGVVS